MSSSLSYQKKVLAKSESSSSVCAWILEAVAYSGLWQAFLWVWPETPVRWNWWTVS